MRGSAGLQVRCLTAGASLSIPRCGCLTVENRLPVPLLMIAAHCPIAAISGSQPREGFWKTVKLSKKCQVHTGQPANSNCGCLGAARPGVLAIGDGVRFEATHSLIF